MVLAKYLASYRIKSFKTNESDYKEVVDRIINSLEEIENICIKNREINESIIITYTANGAEIKEWN